MLIVLLYSKLMLNYSWVALIKRERGWVLWFEERFGPRCAQPKHNESLQCWERWLMQEKKKKRVEKSEKGDTLNSYSHILI